MSIKRVKPEESKAARSLQIERARRSLEESFDFSANWLKDGGIGSKEWKVVGSNNKIETINFAQPLSNKTLLTDPANKVLLESIQKQAFYLREGYLQQQLGYPVWMNHIRTYIKTASWLCLNEMQY